MHVGIHTGPVLVGGGVEAERTAMGQAVHLAARMEQSAPMGRLRISDATWAQVRGLFRVQPLPPLWVKGLDEALKTWLVEAAQTGPEVAMQRGVMGVVTPLIGRDGDMAQRLRLHAELVRSGQACVVQITADAGVGKNRLRQELLQRLGVAEGSPGLLQARAQPPTGLQPYGLLLQWVMRWCGVGDDLPAVQSRTRVIEGLAPWLEPVGHAQAAPSSSWKRPETNASPASRQACALAKPPCWTAAAAPQMPWPTAPAWCTGCAQRTSMRCMPKTLRWRRGCTAI